MARRYVTLNQRMTTEVKQQGINIALRHAVVPLVNQNVVNRMYNHCLFVCLFNYHISKLKHCNVNHISKLRIDTLCTFSAITGAYFTDNFACGFPCHLFSDLGFPECPCSPLCDMIFGIFKYFLFILII